MNWEYSYIVYALYDIESHINNMIFHRWTPWHATYMIRSMLRESQAALSQRISKWYAELQKIRGSYLDQRPPQALHGVTADVGMGRHEQLLNGGINIRSPASDTFERCQGFDSSKIIRGSVTNFSFDQVSALGSSAYLST